MTPTDRPDLMTVSETAWSEASPRAANLHVHLRADRLFSGNAAFENAKELRRLVVALTSQGVPEDATSLQGATLDVSQGLFTRSSSVTYRVRIRLEALDLLASAIDAISECKEATLTSIDWDYQGGPTAAALLVECAQRAHAKARALAAALDARLDGIHSVHEEEVGQPQPVMVASYEAMGMMRAKRACAASELAGLDLAPTKKIGVTVRIACRIYRSNS